ncbi:hypothetical protein [Mycetocola sp.]|uniref:hypothetical protein n=1 Tax=Mycetocola sp. TaxID=1871042 RepID=UPI003988D6B2
MTVSRITNKVYNWASILEPNTREQAERASTMPFIFPHLAVMPEANPDAIWTRFKQALDSVRGPEATWLRVLTTSCVEPMPCATVTA